MKEYVIYKNDKKPITPITSSAKYRNTKLQVRALNQAARELLLAQSSDWLFIITNGTMVDYAKKRIKDHIGRFTKLYYQIKEDKIDEEEILKTICIFRIILPKVALRYAGGRTSRLSKENQKLGIEAGINSLLVGNYLTTLGSDADEDKKMLEDMLYNREIYKEYMSQFKLFTEVK